VEGGAEPPLFKAVPWPRTPKEKGAAMLRLYDGITKTNFCALQRLERLARGLNGGIYHGFIMREAHEAGFVLRGGEIHAAF